MPYDPERVGIVGASGYIGSALARSLVADGQSPRLFGRRAGQTEGLLIEELKSDSAQFVGLDCIIHLSAITTSRAADDELRRANVDLAVDTARRAAEAGVKRFIFLSSLHVHGKSALEAISPATPFKGDNAYGRSKAQAEVALASVAKGTGVDLIILRPPMVYGSGSKGSFPLLAKLVRTGLPLPLAAARSRRSFCSIANLISAVRYAVAAPAPASVLIPADPEDFSTPELVVAMAGAIGREAALWHLPRSFLSAPLRLIRRQEMVTSLFEPLQVDRTHWLKVGWRPVESGTEGVRHALATSRRSASH
jgi:UDP-glucose 4-epimerase